MKRRVRNAITRSNLTMLLLALVVLIPAVYVGATTTVPYFSAKFGGGRTIRAKEIPDVASSLPIYFVRVAGSDMIDTGYYKDNTHLGALIIGDDYLVVEKNGEVVESQTDYTGTLYPLTSELRDDVVSQLESDYPRLKGAFLPFYLSVSDADNASWYAGAVAVIVAILGSVYALFLAITRFLNPARHPIMKRLGRYGMNPDDLLDSIDMDMQQGSTKLGRVEVSRNWIVYGSGGAFNVMRVGDVAWMYMHVLQRRVNFVPAGKTYSAFLWDSHGVSIQAQDKESRVKEILGGIAQRAPWAFLGYSADVQSAWNKDRAAFLQRVAQRKQQVERDE